MKEIHGKELEKLKEDLARENFKTYKNSREGFGIKKCDIWSISNESNRSVKR